MSDARRWFLDLYEDLKYLHEHGGEIREDQHLDLRFRHEAWANRERPRAAPGEILLVHNPTGEWAWERIETRLGLEPLVEPVEEPAPMGPGAPAVGVLTEQAKHLEELLDNGSYTQKALEDETGLTRHYVRRGIELYKLGWPLAENDPELSPLSPKPPRPGYVYWASPENARKHLDSGRVRRRR